MIESISVHLQAPSPLAAVCYTVNGDAAPRVVLHAEGGTISSGEPGCSMNLRPRKCSVHMDAADAVLWAKSILEIVPDEVAHTAEAA